MANVKRMGIRYIALVLAMLMLLSGCSGSSEETTASDEETVAEEVSVEEETATEAETTAEAATPASEESTEADDSSEVEPSDGISSYLVTNVYGDGQKPWYIVLTYDSELDPETVTEDAYEVENYEIIGVYTNSEPEITEESTAGQYVLIELSTDYTNSGYTTSGGGSSSGGSSSSSSSGSSEFKGGGRTGMRTGSSSGSLSNRFTVTWSQTGDIAATDGTVYEGLGYSHTTDYNENDNLLVKNFEQFVFTAGDGVELMYNLYLPDGYSEETLYPMVLFMPDATGEGSDPYLTLTESLGGVIWTTEENQAENPCIVLAPQYEDSNTTDPEYTMELVNYILSSYSADPDRIYLVGQSSGTIRSFKLMIDYPDVFAGGMLVAGQADSAYEDLLEGLAGQNIWMICSAGDERAYPGMTAIMEAVESAGTSVALSGWSAKLSIEEQNELAAAQEAEGTTILFTVYDEGTVMEDDVPVSMVTEHMNTWRVAYNLDTVRNWLFKQSRG